MQTLISKLSSEYATYTVKPTKAGAKRIRDLLNQVQKLAVAEKKRLVEADKAGY